MDLYKDPHRSLYGSYMDPYVDRIWVVYMQMCSQLIQNVNISLDVCTNVLGGFWEAARALRGRFGEGSGKQREGSERAAGKVRAGTGEATGAPAPDPPADISIILL